MKDPWRNYALKSRKVKKSYLREHQDGDQIWKTPETSSCNSPISSRQEQEIKIIPPTYSGDVMKPAEKKTLVKHIDKDDKEFRKQIKEVKGQIKDDVKLKKEVIKSKRK